MYKDLLFTHVEQDCNVVQYAVNHEEAVLCKKTEPYLIWDEMR